jgi:hypothetical protein
MNIAFGRRFLIISRSGAQQLRVQRRRERQPENAALTADASNGRGTAQPQSG